MGRGALFVKELYYGFYWVVDGVTCAAHKLHSFAASMTSVNISLAPDVRWIVPAGVYGSSFPSLVAAAIYWHPRT